MSKSQEAEQYLENKVKVIMEPLISTLLREKPEEPVLFMIEWLNKIAGRSSGSDSNTEKEEYIQLKKEVKRYRKKVQ